MPRIDPSGEHFFIPGPLTYASEPAPPWPHHERHQMIKVAVTPSKVVAPVGSEVVLLAGVCGADGCMYANQEVEWMLAPGGAGHFIALGRKSPLDWIVGFPTWPRKVNDSYAIGTTSSRYLCLTRGTPTPSDDLPVERGQAWISVMSPTEGVSFVTAHAPGVAAWDGHRQTATIHWVDAEFVFPPPAINPAGSKHVFTTTVTRHSSQGPIEGWRVRYEITGGPPAGFSPDGAKAVEVPTNELGQASAEIYQLEPGPGTNAIAIQVIRPADASGERFVVGNGGTHKSWSTPGISLRKTGPASGNLGDTLVYRIEVRNPGDLTAKEVVVSDQISAGLTFLNSNPPAQPAGGKVEWRLGDLLSGEGRTIEVQFRAERAGTLNNCASAVTAEQLTAQDCTATTITAAAAVAAQSLRVEVTVPPQVSVGQEAAFTARITNAGAAPATGLVLVDRYDPGLRHVSGTNPIERDLGDLAPGETRAVEIKLIATQAGRSCNTVEVQQGGGVLGSGQACVMAIAAAGPPAGAGAAVAPPGERPKLLVKKTGPARMNVGETAEFLIEITNQGKVPATQLKVIDHYDPSLSPTEASPNWKWTGADLTWAVEAPLAPGQTFRFNVNCKCVEAAANSCNRVTVTCQEQVRGDDEACLVIAPPLGGVSVLMAEKADPLKVGERTTYEIQVSNRGQAPDGQVVVVVTVPDEMVPLRIETKGPSGVPVSIDGQVVRFGPVAELRPGDLLSYSVQVRGASAGQATCRVDVTTKNLKTPIMREETTRVIAAP
ncbi:MAG TPA: DUF11 domain-containing protein [Pirellulales bacterium]|nr:DUF11 domain-containing protein [Pirellulales bacterium]